jgi:large subunit ribosomal protein L25
MAKRHSVPSLTLEPRVDAGTTVAHRLRHDGKVPGVVYGHGAPTPIAIDARQLADFLHSGERARIVEARIAGAKDSVLLRRLDTDPITRRPLNVDFQRVTRDEEIVAGIAVTTVGTARGVREAGGVLDVVTHALDIRGPAHAIPDALTIDVSELDLHEHVTAAQVALPKGFALVTAPDTVVVSIETSRAAVASGVEELELLEAPSTPSAPPSE